MCGIVGYIGKKQASPILINGLSRLEYRGYDSAGVAFYVNGEIKTFKTPGKLEKLKQLLSQNGSCHNESTFGIGHTRWATHGIPNEINAHPHVSMDESIALVHNGIIENYVELRKDLIAKGHKFISETDTETIVHLVAELKKTTNNLFIAVRDAMKLIEGDFAIVVMDKNTPDRYIVAKRHTPLVIGVGEGENFVASDVPALLDYTRNVIYLDDDEVAEVTMDHIEISNLDGKKLFKQVDHISWEPVTLEKMGFKHFMLKEINEQPGIIRQVLAGRVIKPELPINLEEVKLTGEQLEKINRIQVIACGTSHHAGLIGEYVIEELTGIPVENELASEVIDRRTVVDDKTLVIAVSQSGETADTRAAIAIAREKKAHVMVVTNRIDSAMARDADSVVHVRAGIEISVAATKSFVAQLIAFYLIAIYLAEKKNSYPNEKLTALKQGLFDLSVKLEAILNNQEDIKRCAKTYYNYKDFIFLARGINFPVALEGALKLKEISYINATGYQAGEMKHGPIAMLDNTMPVLTVVTPGKVYKKVISNAQEAKSRDARMIAVANYGDELVESIFENIMHIPETDELLAPVLNVVPLQLLAYYIAEFLGKDVDQPRNLAKTVTVL
ncbi:MAG: glutamine--fructose-6-phosphate transaminase (isomerizing) [Vampirovibrionia bacterium]